ncbi:MAG: HAD family hydrolase [Clostridium fessum]
MYRLCIFDLDGTLLNTVYALTYVTNLTLDAFGLRHVTPEETETDRGKWIPDADEARAGAGGG